MNESRIWRWSTAWTLAGLLAFCGVAAYEVASAAHESQARASRRMAVSKPAPDADKVLALPDESYRKWIYMGTPLTPNELNPPEAPFPEFHNVYIHPDDFAHYERTGEFRDGTVIIKELVSIGSKTATSGKGYFMGDYVGLEAAVKDSEKFPDEPGYWAYYSFGHSYPLAESASPQPVQVCNACHSANADQDWVFTQYYPVIRAAKPTSSTQ